MAAVTSAANAMSARIGAALSDAQYFESSMVRVEDIRRQLDSSSIKEKLDAMKRVIALISLGKDASTFFPDVVKNVAAPTLEVKKLVYLYLVHYAEQKQDLALLAINSFQKDLSDHNQHIRALSLRVLSSIRVKVILQVVIHAINNAAKDSSAYVRKAAAHAISKVCALDAASKDMLQAPLEDLLADRSTQVLGSAIAAWDEVCPYAYDLLHPHYRRFCRALPSIEPWGQTFVLNVLLRYARVHFARNRDINSRNEDLNLLLESATPLLHSLNASVVATTVALYYHLASSAEFIALAVKPLMRLVANQDVASQAVALNIAAAVAVKYPSALIPYISEFYVSPAHTGPIRVLRMRVLTVVCAGAGKPGGLGSKPNVRRMILAELKEYLFRSDKTMAAGAARAFGCLATAHPDSTPAILRTLSSVVKEASNPVVVTESIAVLRRLLQRHPASQVKALPQLIAMLLTEDGMGFKEPAARASVIWLIGEFYEKVQQVGVEALRLLARGFVKEAAEVKLQILNLAAKIVAWGQIHGNDPVDIATGPIRLRLLEYVLTCAKYDKDYDVRDKARMLQAVFLSETKSPLLAPTCKALLSRKPIPKSDKSQDPSFMDDSLPSDVILGSLTHVTNGRRLPGFRPLEPWAESDSDGKLRESVFGDAVSTSVDRQYQGVSSSDYAGMMSSAQSSPSIWERADVAAGLFKMINGKSNTPTNGVGGMTGIGSHNVNMMGIGSHSVTGIGSNSQMVGGGLSGAGAIGSAGGMGSISGTYSGTSSLSRAAARYANVDPESFYAEEDRNQDDDDEESSEYETETESEEDESEEDAVQPTANPGPSTMDDLLSSITNPEPAAPNSANKAANQKPTSEYDLSALLGDMSIGNQPLPANKSPLSPVAHGTSVGQSPWTRLTDGWKAGGLEIEVAYLRDGLFSSDDTTAAKLRVTNRGKASVETVRFTSMSGESFMSRAVISQLAVGATDEVAVEARFRGKTSGVKFAIEVGGSIVGTGELKPGAGYVVLPWTGITPGEFLNREKELRGMFGSDAKMILKAPGNADWMGMSGDMKRKMMNACFVAHVKTAVGGRGTGDDERFEMSFAGYLPGGGIGGKRVVLLKVVVREKNDGGCECGIWVGCEDVLFSANLMTIVKGVLSEME